MNNNQPLHIIELGHIVLYVRNIEVSASFYGSILGWKRIKTLKKSPYAAFSSGRTHHELLLIEAGNNAASKPKHLQIGMYHFGLKIGESDNDLRKAISVLQKHNIKINSMADHHVTHSLYIEDPDGNEIELYIDVEGVDWKSDPSLIMQPTKQLEID